ncbi:hypothetical protein BaRGS_00033892 [Batillaria attramentaria]|uniref:Uncharacterized protein n=1 Tax=Batillaria attramentaria TaxID=370345 RepID=A0ABD0JJJ5_9CAEN
MSRWVRNTPARVCRQETVVCTVGLLTVARRYRSLASPRHVETKPECRELQPHSPGCTPRPQSVAAWAGDHITESRYPRGRSTGPETSYECGSVTLSGKGARANQNHPLTPIGGVMANETRAYWQFG